MAGMMRSFVPLLLKAVLAFGYAHLLGVHPMWAAGQSYGQAHATFYGGQDASGTMGGACGYGNLYSAGYGTQTAALSNALFKNGLSCGACFMLTCNLGQTQYCYPGKSIMVTATNNCPQGSYGGWCDGYRPHFDLSYPMFSSLAQPRGGVIPVTFKRVNCVRMGGVRFKLLGNAFFDYVMVYNVAGSGDVTQLAIRGQNTNWIEMMHNWGQYWSSNVKVVGQGLSFQVTLGNGATQQFWNVAGSNWGFGQTFESDGNFH